MARQSRNGTQRDAFSRTAKRQANRQDRAATDHHHQTRPKKTPEPRKGLCDNALQTMMNGKS